EEPDASRCGAGTLWLVNGARPGPACDDRGCDAGGRGPTPGVVHRGVKGSPVSAGGVPGRRDRPSPVVRGVGRGNRRRVAPTAAFTDQPKGDQKEDEQLEEETPRTPLPNQAQGTVPRYDPDTPLNGIDVSPG